MQRVLDAGPEDLVPFGAVPSQVVDLRRDDDPRILRYLDLCGSDLERPLIVESDGEPRIHVLRGRGSDQRAFVERWCLRTTIRGDGAWIGLLEPGRLRVYRPELEGKRVHAVEVVAASRAELSIPRLLYDAEHDVADSSIRTFLVRLLGTSIEHAIDGHGLSADDALSLVGRGLFWRFLIDRKMLAGLDPSEVCAGASSWESCMDSKAHALRTFEWLDCTFNGGLLLFGCVPARLPARVFESVLGNIAHGATEHGQMRLPTDWTEIDFAHVPMVLLSQIYEAFKHARSPRLARSTSIHYTPRHIAELMVREALESMADVERPRVLDPAAGAGIFLVTAFRQLAEREWAHTGSRPGRRVLRRILDEQLGGFEIDENALRLAELALYLSALELDPNPRPPSALRFEALRGKVLHVLPEGSLGPVDHAFAGKFDLVVGNPPWTAKARGTPEEASTGDKALWARHSRAVVSERLGAARVESFDFPDNNPDLPFVWRAMEWARSGGRIAFVTHARWLFGLSPRAVQARRDLLEALHVTGILNGSELRQTSVWPNVDAPFCMIFGTNEVPPAGAALTFVSPRLETSQIKQQRRMRIDWSDARPIAVREIIAAPWRLKARFRGNRIAERTLGRMLSRGVPLRRYLGEQLGTCLANGYQLGGQARRDKQVPAGHMWHLPDLKQAGDGELGFEIDASSLPRFRRAKLLSPRRKEIYRAPLLLLRKAIPADGVAARTHRVDTDLAFHESFSGISFASSGARGRAIRNYLQMLLQSSIYPFFEILTDPQYGVFVDAVYWESVQELPVVPFDTLTARQRKEVDQLGERLLDDATPAVREDIDRLVFQLYGLDELDVDAVRDTVATALPSSESRNRSLAPPSEAERASFTKVLQGAMQEVLEASGCSVISRERGELGVEPWRFVEVVVGPQGAEPAPPVGLPLEPLLERADADGVSMVIVHPRRTVALVGMLDRYGLWTRTRARLLANDLLGAWNDGWLQCSIFCGCGAELSSASCASTPWSRCCSRPSCSPCPAVRARSPAASRPRWRGPRST